MIHEAKHCKCGVGVKPTRNRPSPPSSIRKFADSKECRALSMSIKKRKETEPTTKGYMD